MGSLFNACFPSSSSSKAAPAVATPPGAVADCIFCAPNLTPDSPRFRVVHHDERFIAFHDRAPASAVHLLAVPRKHVESVKELSGEEGAELVRALRAFGEKALEIDQATRPETLDAATAAAAATAAPTEQTKLTSTSQDIYGFHIPPLNSVSHLHLHCQRLPYVSRWRALEYRQSGTAAHKGWAWFITAPQAAGILEKGGKVRIGPCGKL